MEAMEIQSRKVEWEGKEITIPQPFSRVEHLLNYIVSLLGWQLQNGINYENCDEFIDEIKKDIEVDECDIRHIFDVLDIKLPVKPSVIDYTISDGQDFTFDIEGIKARRSIRSYNNQDVSREDIAYVLDAARHAPSARNIQPSEFIIIRDKRTRDELSKISRQKQPSMAPVSIVVLGDISRASLAGKLSMHDTTTGEKGVKFFVYMDAAAAIQNMLLAANHLGLGSLWISSFNSDALAKLLNLPEDHVPLAIVTLGRYDSVPVKPPKRNLNELVHVEKYGEKTHDPRHYNFSYLIHVRY
jgi:nitroreductase